MDGAHDEQRVEVVEVEAALAAGKAAVFAADAGETVVVAAAAGGECAG